MGKGVLEVHLVDARGLSGSDFLGACTGRLSRPNCCPPGRVWCCDSLGCCFALVFLGGLYGDRSGLTVCCVGVAASCLQGRSTPT